MIIASLLAAAAAVVLWPRGVSLPHFLSTSPATPAGVSFEASISDLASVRRRLANTSTLTAESVSAIETITLALVSGSDV